MTTSPDVERLANLRAAKDLMDRAYAEPLDLDALASGRSSSPISSSSSRSRTRR
jgi:hypothetical protein